MFSQAEEFLLFALLGFHDVLDEFQQRPVDAHHPRFRQAANLSGDLRRQTEALPYRSAGGSHCAIMAPLVR
jgi:hypothetical protein